MCFCIHTEKWGGLALLFASTLCSEKCRQAWNLMAFHSHSQMLQFSLLVVHPLLVGITFQCRTPMPCFHPSAFRSMDLTIWSIKVTESRYLRCFRSRTLSVDNTWTSQESKNLIFWRSLSVPVSASSPMLLVSGAGWNRCESAPCQATGSFFLLWR